MRRFARQLPYVVVLLFAVSPQVVRAEVNIVESLEWLMAASARVVTGTVTAAQPQAPSSEFRTLSVATVKVTATLKGQSAAHLCVALPNLDPRELERYRAGRTELILFLGSRSGARSFEGRLCDQAPLLGGDARPFVVPLDRPGTTLITATTFAVLKDRQVLLAAAREAARRLAASRRPPQRAFLEVPASSEAFKILYSGSDCFLVVPDVLFPRARPKLGR